MPQVRLVVPVRQVTGGAVHMFFHFLHYQVGRTVPIPAAAVVVFAIFAIHSITTAHVEVAWFAVFIPTALVPPVPQFFLRFICWRFSCSLLHSSFFAWFLFNLFAASSWF